MDDVYQYWSPPNKDLVRIPPLIVTRLKYDIMEYLAERQADGKRVLQLFHRYSTSRQTHLTDSLQLRYFTR